MSSWLSKWEPEDQKFWQQEGSRRAWLTLGVTTFSLVASFATWFVMSAVAVRLPQIGFKFTTLQLFWLAAMPGLAGGTLRLIHTFLIPVLGTRMTVTGATFLKLIPMVWLGFAVQNPATPYEHFVMIALLCGMGGGDFSSYMPSTSLFFPKRLQGTALGIQAGVGNFGVSLTQFVTPWIVGFAVLGAVVGGSQVMTKADPAKDVKVIKEAGVVRDILIGAPELAAVIMVTKEGDVLKDVVALPGDATRDMKIEVKKDANGVVTDVAIAKLTRKDIWLQNAAFWYVPYLIVAGVLCWILLRSVPMKRPSFGEMVRNMTDSKHAWFCVITYVMTFGSFSGLSAAFPLMIKTIYGTFEGAPDPLKYAYLGPLIGSAIRAVGGPLSDRFGGSIWTQLSGIGLIAGCIYLIMGGYLAPTSVEQFGGFLWGMLWLFLMAGIGNFATFRQYPIIFAFSPRQGAQILGWTGAWAAYGPFVFSSLIGGAIARYGSAVPFFAGAIVFYAIASLINWVYFTKPRAERGDWGVGKTWWDRVSESERERLRAQA